MDTVRKWTQNEVFRWVATIVGALLAVWVIQALFAKPFTIPSESMLPTMEIGDHVFADRLTYRFRSPQNGDIVVFHPPKGAASATCSQKNIDGFCVQPGPTDDSIYFVKRIVGVGGDRIQLREGHLFRNGKAVNEPYIRPCSGSGCTWAHPLTVPKGTYFMMGDNRGDSLDSRYWGPIPQSAMIGVVRARYWPINRLQWFS